MRQFQDDLPQQGPLLAAQFNTVDSFDMAAIPRYFAAVDAQALAAKSGADFHRLGPGMFSINRLYGEAVLPAGETYTFWGKGVSRGIRMPSAAFRASRPVCSTTYAVAGGDQPFAAVAAPV